MADFAALLDREHAVHFDSQDKGSTKLKARVECEDVPKVKMRLLDIRQGNPPKDATKIFAQIDGRLANDNAAGCVFVEGEEGPAAQLLIFPGRDRPRAQRYGPFTQEGSLDGLLISAGARTTQSTSVCKTGRQPTPIARRTGPLPAS